MNPDINLANTIVGAIMIPPDIDIISEFTAGHLVPADFQLFII
jgi:hypothetical protein